MYSNSNAFLRSQSQHPSGQQYGVAANNPSMAGGQQPQQQLFAPKPTGYDSQQRISQLYTGYSMQGRPNGALQSQPQPQEWQSQQGFQAPMPLMPPHFQQRIPAQNQNHQQHQSSCLQPSHSRALAPPSPPMKPQPTGFTEMAASFQTGVGARARDRPAVRKKANAIPNIRLSFITAQDQAKFETLFKSAVGDGSTMSGEKARDLLLRSRLDGDALSHIWTLADTTRAGQLYFPEFALAMYMCNIKLTGKTLPPTLPENIRNEVSSMVDIINFSVVEDGSSASQPSNAPLFTSDNASMPPVSQQPQVKPSDSQLLQSQMTGFPGHQTGFNSPSQGLQPQQAGFPGIQNPHPTGFQGSPQSSMPPMSTGLGQSLTTGFGGGMNMTFPLNAQPTGRPGQWGLVNTPASGLPSIDALQARMMPQPGREPGSFTTQGLQGNAVIPWAITKEEKSRYDALFRAWDGLSKGFIGGDQAIEIFGQSGLEKPDLERVWTLSDNGNKGRLDLDEFAVAMHLIYRKLNGYPLPNVLPPELVPPSARNFSQSIGTLKSMLHQDSDLRKTSGAALLPQKTGVSYMKNRSFRGDAGVAGAGRKDATVFRNDDEDFGYRSSARRRMGSSSPRPDSPASVKSGDDLGLDQLRKIIKEKQVLLDAMDFADEKSLEEDDVLDRRDRREAEELYRRIRRMQSDIDAHSDAVTTSSESEAERRALKRQLQKLTDKVPELASQVRKTEKAIMEARLELFRLKEAKAHPGSGTPIIGTGPGGSVTESDRLKARAKAMMQQRTAALTGKKIDIGPDLDAPKRLEEETIKAKKDKESNESMVRDVEESVRDFARGIEDGLKQGETDKTNEHEKRRWEEGLGVEDEVRDFIFDLQRESRAARLRAQDKCGTRTGPRVEEEPRTERVVQVQVTSAAPTEQGRSVTPAGGSYASYKTAEERAAFIKQQAEQRMAERLAALGIKAPSKYGESAAQRAEREKSERDAKIRKAEAEDTRRESERQARIAEEQGVPPPEPAAQVAAGGTRKPPLPPTRKGGKPEMDDGKRLEEAQGAKAAEEERLAQEHEQQQRKTQEMEEMAKVEDEFEKERKAAEARLKALEEQVQQGKLRKEERRRKKATLAEAREKEAKMAARRAEIEAAKERERKLQRQLETMNQDSSSDEDAERIAPQASTPRESGQKTSSPREVAPVAPPPPRPPPPPPPPPPAIVTSPPVDTESKNPYFKMMTQASEAASPGPVTEAALTTAATPQADMSTNPFHRMVQGGRATASPGGIMTRKRADSDDWDSGKEDDEESDDDRPGGGNAAQLASMLFGTMGPPRPLSAAGRESTAGSPGPASEALVAPPVPAPAMPKSDAPATPPPPPPPVASSGTLVAPDPPPMATLDDASLHSALPQPPPLPPSLPGAGGATAAATTSGGRPAGFLSEIQMGKSLKKATTKDMSGAAVAGRVLD